MKSRNRTISSLSKLLLLLMMMMKMMMMMMMMMLKMKMMSCAGLTSKFCDCDKADSDTVLCEARMQAVQCVVCSM